MADEILAQGRQNSEKMKADIENLNRQFFLDAFGLAESRTEYSNSS